MQLSERFLNLVQQQLQGFEAAAEIKQLVVYVAQSKSGSAPTLEVVGEWPYSGKSLPPVEDDPELRTPSSERRWYPLQEGSVLLGVIRAEVCESKESWGQSLDNRLKAAAVSLGHCLALEIERTRLLDELSQQREQIGLMVHQLRNPLAALRTYAQLLLRKLGPDSSHRNLIEGLLTEQDQLNRYISALDELSRPEFSLFLEGASPLLLPPVLPKAGAMTVRSLLDPLIERASATAALQKRQWYGPLGWPNWSVQPRPKGVGVIAEIVANLLENAFRYSSDNSPIGLALTEDGLFVWDGGAQITAKERERIFDKGYRGESSNKRPGSGLGLALGRKLAEELGGDLDLINKSSVTESHIPSEVDGNIFYLRLPIKLLPLEEA